MISVTKAVENFLFVLASVIVVCALVCQLSQMKPVVVVSGSMEPSITTGSLALIDTKESAINIGDVVSFRAGDALVTHRVIEITEEGYRTKGDNNDIADVGTVTQDQIEGKLVYDIPGLGYLLKVIALPAGTALTLLYIIMKGINRVKGND